MKIAFIIGPYHADTCSEIDANIQLARKAARRLWRSGYAVICPHSNSSHFGGVVSEETFRKGYLEILERCALVDLCVVLPDWQRSEACVAEVKLAALLGREIWYVSDIETL